MADLIAQGPEFAQRWRRELPTNTAFIVGRAAGAWSTPWDDRISREHVQLCWNGQDLKVEQLPGTRNPIFVQGRPAQHFHLAAGEHFVIGNTTFTVSGDRVEVTLDAPRPDREQTFRSDDLRQHHFRDANQRIDLLSRLPEVIGCAATDDELFVRLVNLLLSGIDKADAAALVFCESTAEDATAKVTPEENVAQHAAAHVLHWDRRRLMGGNFSPSQRLIQQAISRGQTVLHSWNSGAANPQFTASDTVDWAFCTPVLDEACRGWGIYLAGRFGMSTPGSAGHSDLTDLRDDIKFTELAAATLSSLRQVKRLERQRAGFAQFFAPVVLDALASSDPQTVFTPRETEVAVLFCDLRGFSLASEHHATNLMGLLERVSKALGVMTHHILDHGGVVGDFQGDAAMGFWGWPLAEPNAAGRAALAALGIRQQFEAAARQAGHPLAEFQVGIGIATGRAVAGKIGTADHVKVTVFGPVVNLASRLEAMTRQLGAAILIDETTAQRLKKQTSRDIARVRRVANVRPFGMDAAVQVSELLPGTSEMPQISDAALADYENALDAFNAGNWPQAFDLLHRVPASDRAKDFLTVYIAQNGRKPPPHWDGVVPLSGK